MAHRSHKGIHYFLIVWKHEQDKWVLNNQRFILNVCDYNNKEKLMGQYITSMWYNSSQDKEKGMRFGIVGVNHKGQLGTTIDLLNSNSSLWGSTCEFIELFECGSNVTDKILINTKDEGRSNYEFIGKINKSNILRMNFNWADNTLLATLPEFTRILY